MTAHQLSEAEGVFVVTKAFRPVHQSFAGVGEVDLVCLDLPVRDPIKFYFEIRETTRSTDAIHRGEVVVGLKIPLSGSRVLFLKAQEDRIVLGHVLRNAGIGSQVFINGALFLVLPEGSVFDILVVDEDGNPVGTPDPGVVHLIASSPIDVNGDHLLDLRPEQPHSITVQYETAGLVPTTILDADTVEVPDPGGASMGGGGLPLKTGQTFVAEPNDDGANQIGRETDWFTLDYVNPWGHTYRFTGLGGGYVTNPLETNSVLLDWRNADGTPGTEASVVTDDIIVDWATLSRDATKVVMWYRVPDLTFRTFAAAMAQQAGISISTYVSNWKTPNHNLGPTIFFGGRVTHALNWFPMTKTTGVKATDLAIQWLSSEQGTSFTLAKTIAFSSINPMIGNLAKTSTRPQGLYCRIGTVSGTVIT